MFAGAHPPFDPLEGVDFPPPPDRSPVVVPVALQIIAWLWIFLGVGSVIGMIAALLNGHLSVDLNVLGIFIGRGMLRLRRGWWLLAVVLLTLSVGLALLLGVLMAVLGLGGAEPTLEIGGEVHHLPEWVVIPLLILIVGGITTFFTLHLLPSVRRVMDLPETRKLRREMHRPWLAAAIVAVVVGIGVATTAFSAYVASNHHVWEFRPAEEFPDGWADAFAWSDDQSGEEPAAPLTHVDLIVQAELHGELLAESHLRLAYAYAEAEGGGPRRLTRFEIEDLSPEPPGRATIVTTSSFYPEGAAVGFNLVTEPPEHRHYTTGYEPRDRIGLMFPVRQSGAGPTLGVAWNWRFTDEPDPLENLEDIEVEAAPLLSSSTDDMFTEEQPIHWRIRIEPPIAPISRQRNFVIPPGEVEPNPTLRGE